MTIGQPLIRLTIALACLCWASLAAAQDKSRFPTDRITPRQWQTYLSETLAKPNVQAYESANQIIVEVPQEAAIYVFTAKAHPAHPAVVIRRVVERDGQIFIDRKGHYAGNRAAYDHWWGQFDALDEGARQSTRD